MKKIRNSKFEIRTQRARPPSPLLNALLLLIGLAVVAAIMFDANHFMNQATQPQTAPQEATADVVAMTASTSRYTNDEFHFSVALPPGWTMESDDMIAPFDVRLLGPNLMSLSVEVTKVAYSDIDTLMGRLQGIEREQQRNTHIERVEFKGFPAARRMTHLTREVLFMLDVLAGGREYHLQVSLPSDLEQTHRVVALWMLESFAPTD